MEQFIAIFSAPHGMWIPLAAVLLGWQAATAYWGYRNVQKSYKELKISLAEQFAKCDERITYLERARYPNLGQK